MRRWRAVLQSKHLIVQELLEKLMASKSASRRPRTATRAELAAAVYSRVNVSRAEAYELVNKMLEELASALSRGEDVKLSSFGAFVVRSKNERVGRNPKTGVEVKIAARKVVAFRASRILRDRLGAIEQNEMHAVADDISQAP